MEKIPDQVGFLILTEDGAVLESGGELENDERVATIITDLISLSNRYLRLLIHYSSAMHVCSSIIVTSIFFQY